MATLAVFIALGGGAWAVAIGRNDVGSREIAKNAVGTSELKNDKAKGTDVDESTLGQVPSAAFADSAGTANSANTANSATTAENANSAATANDANTIGGMSVTRINARQTAGTADQTILNVAGLQLKMNCIGAGSPHLTAATTKLDSSLYGYAVDTVGVPPVSLYAFDHEDGGFDPTTPIDVDAELSAGTNPTVAHLEYEAPDGSVASVDLAYDTGIGTCIATGTAVSG